MKKLFIPFLTGLLLLCFAGANAQEFKEHITKEFPVTSAATGQLAIYNLNGPIRVEGYAGDKIVVDIDKVITADDNDRLTIGKNEFRLGFDQHGDTIVVYIAEPFDTRPHRWENRNGNNKQIDYDFQLSFTVRVPYTLGLHISTVNRGDISVSDVAGPLDINNVNGPITIKNAKGATRARTINGDLTVNYLDTPPTVAELTSLLKQLGMHARQLLRQGEDDYRTLGLDNPLLDDPALIAAMVAHPKLIERPIVVANGKAALGRPPEAVLAIL